MCDIEEIEDDVEVVRCDKCRCEIVGDPLPFEDHLLCEDCFDRINRNLEMINFRKIESEGFYDYED